VIARLTGLVEGAGPWVLAHFAWFFVERSVVTVILDSRCLKYFESMGNNMLASGVDQQIRHTKAQFGLRIQEQRFAGMDLQADELILDERDCFDEQCGDGQRRSRQGRT
jgi:hypothetical protein